MASYKTCIFLAVVTFALAIYTTDAYPKPNHEHGHEHRHHHGVEHEHRYSHEHGHEHEHKHEDEPKHEHEHKHEHKHEPKHENEQINKEAGETEEIDRLINVVLKDEHTERNRHHVPCNE